jgi:hypothetical protein
MSTPWTPTSTGSPTTTGAPVKSQKVSKNRKLAILGTLSLAGMRAKDVSEKRDTSKAGASKTKEMLAEHTVGKQQTLNNLKTTRTR